MKLLEVQIDFFVPLWRRVALVAFCFVWSLVEFSNGMVFWGSIFIALGTYSLWQFFFDGWPARHAVGDVVENDEVVNEQVMSDGSTELNSASAASTTNNDEVSNERTNHV